MSRRVLMIMALALLASAGQPQQLAEDVIRSLGTIFSADAGEWRFQHPAAEGGERVDLDDGAWPAVRPEHSWQGDNTAAWYRKWVVVPEEVGGVSVAGSRLTLRIAVDDDMEVYVNGEARGRFHWDQGLVILSDRVQPGDRFLVAVRAINQGGPGRLLWASLTYDAFADMRPAADAHRMRLQFCRRLLDTPRIAGERERYAALLDQGAQQVDFDAVQRRDRQAFEASIQRSMATLQPFADLAKQYTLYLVGHAHIDMNWLWLWPETKQVCRQTWRQALAFMEEFPDFRFTQSQPGAYVAIEQEDPELFARIQEAVKRGQWEPAGASWVEGDTNMASGEILARHSLLTHAYYRDKFGYTPDVAWLPDNFGHAWTVPSIFADAGIKHYYFARCSKGYPVFWWEGPDGQRLMGYSYGGYGEQFRADRGAWPLEAERQVGMPIAMLVYGVGDHGGGPTREDIETAKRLQEEPFFPNIRFATTREYFEAAAKLSGGKLPVVKDELNFVFEGCYTTHADVKKWNRESENLLPTAEAISLISAQRGGQYPAADLTQAWRNTCFNQFHDIFDGSAIHDSYQYSRELYEQAKNIADRAIDDGLRRLYAEVDTTGEGEALIIWNPVAWERQEFVEATLSTAEAWQGVLVTDSQGKELPAQVMDCEAQGTAFRTTVGFVANLPALGYEVFHVAPKPAAQNEQGALAPQQTATSAVTQDRGIPLLWLKEGGPNLEAYVQPQILWEDPHGMSAWNIGAIRSTTALQPQELKRRCAGPVCTRWSTRYSFRNSTLGLDATIYRDLQRVDFDLTVDWREVGNPQDGGPFLKMAVATNLADPRATFEIPWGSIERAANGAEVPAQKWIDLSEMERVVPRGGREAKAIDLSAYFNEDVIATADNPTDGDFDYGRRAYSHEIFAGAREGVLTVEGIPFRVPPVAPGALNCVRAEGQRLEWPAEACPALAVLGASSNGRHGGTARLVYADGTEQAVGLYLSDWCLSPAAGEVKAAEVSYRIVDGQRGEPATYLWMARLSVDPKKKLAGIVLPNDRNLHIFGLAFAENVTYRATRGLSLLNDCKYGFDVKDNVMRMSVVRASYDPDPLPDQGEHRVRFTLYPHEGGWQEAGIPRRAMELNNPPIVRLVEKHTGTQPRRQSFVCVEPAEMILTALKPAEDGNGIIARVYNSCGVGGTARITCALPFTAAVACNLLEEPRETNALKVEGSVVELDLEGRLHGTVRLER